MTQESIRHQRKRAYQHAQNALAALCATSPLPQTDAELQGWLDRLQATVPEIALTPSWLRANIASLAMDQPDMLVVERDDAAWRAVFPRYPVDPDDGFARAFDPADVSGYLAALERFGVVVIRVWDADTCAATVAAMFEELNAQLSEQGRPALLNPEDPATWHDAMWPSSRKFLIDRPALHPQAFRNRVCPTITGIFAQIWGERRLRVTLDNWGVVRGTRAIPSPQPDGSVRVEERPRWGRPIKPHWDYNPWLFAQERPERDPGYQGLVALNDHTLDTGCHLTLPGGVAFLPRWCRERVRPKRLGLKRSSHRPEPDDPIRAWMQPLPMRRGDMVIWSWGQLHGNTPNRSAQMRLHQFIRMFPCREVDPFYEEHDRYAPARVLAQWGEHVPPASALPQGLDARRRLGFEPWAQARMA